MPSWPQVEKLLVGSPLGDLALGNCSGICKIFSIVAGNLFGQPQTRPLG
jgi:hypothetical protein